jgi:excisionase family DNA binding protein
MSPVVAAAAKNMEAQRLPDWKLSYRVDEAAAATGVSVSTIWKRLRAGKIKAKRDEGVTLILRKELQQYLDNIPARG